MLIPPSFLVSSNALSGIECLASKNFFQWLESFNTLIRSCKLLKCATKSNPFFTEIEAAATEAQKAELIKYYQGVVSDAIVQDEQLRADKIKEVEELIDHKELNQMTVMRFFMIPRLKE